MLNWGSRWHLVCGLNYECKSCTLTSTCAGHEAEFCNGVMIWYCCSNEMKGELEELYYLTFSN